MRGARELCRILHDERGWLDAEIAEALGVHHSTVYRWRTEGAQGREPHLAKPLCQALERLVDQPERARAAT